MKFGLLLILTMIHSFSAWGYNPPAPDAGLSSETPVEIQGVGITEHLGQSINLNLEFTDENGELVKLGQYFHSGKPVMLAMIYYSCPNLCNFQLNGTVEALQKMKGEAGKDYELVAVSMDHSETAVVASAKKENYMKALGQPGAEKAWHFLVGTEANVKTLADQIGFGFKWSDDLQQFAHAAATIIVTSDGTISRYLQGITYAPETLRMALVEASSGKIGSIIEQFVMYCFQFNPAKNKYTLYAYNIMRIGAALTILLMALILVPLWIRERQRKAHGA